MATHHIFVRLLCTAYIDFVAFVAYHSVTIPLCLQQPLYAQFLFILLALEHLYDLSEK